MSQKDKNALKEAEFYQEVHHELPTDAGVKKPMSVFVSGTKRFTRLDPQPEEKPGPGNYEIKSFTDELQRRVVYQTHIAAAKEHKKQQQNALKGLHNNRIGAPSIPGRDQQLGYTVADGQVKFNVNSDKLDGTAGAASVGPGQYNVPSSIDPHKMRGVQWKFTTVKTSTRAPEVNAVGPWSYNPTKDIKPLYKYKQSAAFASETPRKFLGRENSSLASKKTRWTLAEDDDDEDESEYLLDATPGPGYYHVAEATSSFKKQAKDHRFQLFNVGSERFPQAKTVHTNLGPGKYFKEAGLNLKTFNAVLANGGKRTASKSKTANHFDIKKDPVKEALPGPGHYELKNSVTTADRSCKTRSRGRSRKPRSLRSSLLPSASREASRRPTKTPAQAPTSPPKTKSRSSSKARRRGRPTTSSSLTPNEQPSCPAASVAPVHQSKHRRSASTSWTTSTWRRKLSATSTNPKTSRKLESTSTPENRASKTASPKCSKKPTTKTTEKTA